MPGEIRLDYPAHTAVGEVATSARRWWSAEWTHRGYWVIRFLYSFPRLCTYFIGSLIIPFRKVTYY